MSSNLKKIYAVFDPSPLGQGQDDLYVSLDDLRGDHTVVRELARKIRLANRFTCQVLAGHKGSGKSTELWKLQQELETTDSEGQKYFVVQVRADDHMDRNDVDFPDVLIAIVRQLAKDLQERENITLQPGYFKDRWERLKQLMLSEVSFEGLDLSAGMAKISTTLKNSPDARHEIRKLLEPDTNNWLRAANDVIGDAKLQLENKGYADLVIVVDDLDKIVTKSHHDAGCTTTEYLFVHRAAQLTAFECHLIYTMPLELVYSHHEQTLEDRYAGNIPVIPMVKIATPPPKLKLHTKGVNAFREIIRKRMKQAGATYDELFTNKNVETSLIKLSGGQPTELMSLIREAIISGDLPIQAVAVRRGQEDLERSYRRQLRPDHWPILQEIRKTGQFTRTQTNEQAFRELLESRAILLYRNGNEWYGLHPVIAEIQPPSTAPVDEV